MCLEVDGLTCGSCVSKAERALLSVDGVLEVGQRHIVHLWTTCALQSAITPLLQARCCLLINLRSILQHLACRLDYICSLDAVYEYVRGKAQGQKRCIYRASKQQ